jgi:ribosomal protein L27
MFPYLSRLVTDSMSSDQYVIPGNILYKQRGTIWHAGENTILGRDHTIHAAVAGYVKYYRDPLRHPTRQYIGVVFNKDDKLPYPPNSPRVRRLGLVAVKRKTEGVVVPALSPSGIPLKIVRKGVTATPVVSTPETAEEAVDAAKTAERTKRLTARQRKAEAAQLRLAQRKMQKETRVLHLQDDYSYREHNWEIGRLVGAAGRIQGAAATRSRKAALRLRQRKKDIEFGTRRAEAMRKKERHLETLKRLAEKRVEKDKEAAAHAVKAKAKKEKAEKAKTLA